MILLHVFMNYSRNYISQQHNTNRLNVLFCFGWNIQHEKLKVLFQALGFFCKISTVLLLFHQGWQVTLAGHLSKKSHTSCKCLELFNLHRKKQIFHQVLRGSPRNKPCEKKKAEKQKVIEKNVQCFHSLSNCLWFSYLLKEFNSACVLYITCFTQTCYKIRLCHMLRAQKQSRWVGFFFCKNISAKIPGTRKEFFLIYQK